MVASARVRRSHGAPRRSMTRRRRWRRRCGVRPLTARLLVAARHRRGGAGRRASWRRGWPTCGRPTAWPTCRARSSGSAAALAGGETIGVFGDYDVDGVTTAAVLASGAAGAGRHGGAAGGRAATRATAWARRRRPLRGGRLHAAGHRRLRHQRPRGAARRARARRRHDRHRPPPAARRASPRRSRSSTRAAPTTRSRSRAWRRAASRSTWRPRCARGSAPALRSARPAGPGGAGHDRRHGAAGRREPHPGRGGAARAVGAQAARPGGAGRARRAGERPHHGARRRVPADAASERRRAAWARRSSRSTCCWPADADAERLAASSTTRTRSGSACRSWSGRRRWRRRPRRAGAGRARAGGGRRGLAPGVVGIIAARLVDRFARPAIAIGFRDGEGRGSARTVAGFNLFRRAGALRGAPDEVRRPRRRGGDEHRDRRAGRLPRRFAAEAARQLRRRAGRRRSRSTPRWRWAISTAAFAEELARLAPFGAANREPLFALSGRDDAGDARRREGPPAAHAGPRRRDQRGDRVRLRRRGSGRGRPRRSGRDSRARHVPRPAPHPPQGEQAGPPPATDERAWRSD